MSDPRSIHPRLRGLVAALERLPGLTVPVASAEPEGWEIHIDIEQTDRGWLVLEFLGWFVSDRRRGSRSDRLEVLTTSAPWVNGPGTLLGYVLSSFDEVSNPEQMTESFLAVLDKFEDERDPTMFGDPPEMN